MGELVLKSADAIMTTLIAIVESDRSENQRIEEAMDTCGNYVAQMKALHGIDTGKRPTVAPQPRAPGHARVRGHKWREINPLCDPGDGS